jgi:hypothetical protein
MHGDTVCRLTYLAAAWSRVTQIRRTAKRFAKDDKTCI